MTSTVERLIGDLQAGVFTSRMAALAALAMSLASTIDAGTEPNHAALSRELRITLDQLCGLGAAHDEHGDLFGVDLPAPVRDVARRRA